MATMPHEGTFNILYGPLGIPVGSQMTSGYLARPDVVGAFPVVLVLPDIYGLTSFEKDLCRRFARHGVAGVALDIHRGAAPGAAASMDEAIVAYQQLSDPRVLTDIGDAHMFLVSEGLDWVLPERIGVLGTDVGGRFGLLYAAGRSDLGAVVAVQAPLGGDDHRSLSVRDALGQISAPVLGLYGADDDLIPAAGVDVAQGLNPAGTWILYDGTGHDFLNDGMDGYHPGAANDAFVRMNRFVLDRLPAPAPAAY